MPVDRVPVLVRMDRVRPRGDVLHDLTAAGLHVDRTMTRLGIVSGSVASGSVGALGDVAGVASVELERVVRTV